MSNLLAYDIFILDIMYLPINTAIKAKVNIHIQPKFQLLSISSRTMGKKQKPSSTSSESQKICDTLTPVKVDKSGKVLISISAKPGAKISGVTGLSEVGTDW